MHLNENDTQPLYLQVYEQFKQEILCGAFSAGEKLPPIRTLSDEIGVSKNTVEASYRLLVSEGYVVSRPGSGYTVENLSLEELGRIAGVRLPAYTGGEVVSSPASTQFEYPPCDFDFTYGNLESNLFPSKIWQKLTSETLFSIDSRNINTYTNQQGDYLLRKAIADSLLKSRGVICSAEQVIIQAGTQASVQSLAQLFDFSHDIIAFEEPGYDGVRRVFQNNHYKIIPCRSSLGTRQFMQDLAQSNARLVFVTPSNQFPTGGVMTTKDRFGLIHWAEDHDVYIIEDDYCCEFRYDGRPSPAIQSLDSAGRVIYLGTFSKALSPALRMSYLVLPAHLLRRWQVKFHCYYPTVPWLSQVVLRKFIEQGYWEKLVRKARTNNRYKHDILIDSLNKSMGDRVDIMESGAGLHLLVGVKDERSQDTLVHQASEKGVRVYKTDKYWLEGCPPDNNHILVGFSAIPKESIEPGIERLSEAWFGKR